MPRITFKSRAEIKAYAAEKKTNMVFTFGKDVIDLSDFLEILHPGGAEVVTDTFAVGDDIQEGFKSMHVHSEAARMQVYDFKIGTLEEE